MILDLQESYSYRKHAVKTNPSNGHANSSNRPGNDKHQTYRHFNLGTCNMESSDVNNGTFYHHFLVTVLKVATNLTVQSWNVTQNGKPAELRKRKAVSQGIPYIKYSTNINLLNVRQSHNRLGVDSPPVYASCQQ